MKRCKLSNFRRFAPKARRARMETTRVMFSQPFYQRGTNVKFQICSDHILRVYLMISCCDHIRRVYCRDKLVTNSRQTRDKLATKSRQPVLKKKTDLNLDFSRKSHASNHFSTRCMMDYHGLKSLNNFQHLIFTVSEALKSTANNGRPPVQNSPKVVVLNLDFSIKNSIKKQIST